MKQCNDVTRKSYASPSAEVVTFADDTVRTSAQEIGVSWLSDWNNSWDGWGNQEIGG